MPPAAGVGRSLQMNPWEGVRGWAWRGKEELRSQLSPVAAEEEEEEEEALSPW